MKLSSSKATDIHMGHLFEDLLMVAHTQILVLPPPGGGGGEKNDLIAI